MLRQGFTEDVGFELGLEMGLGEDGKGPCLHRRARKDVWNAF